MKDGATLDAMLLVIDGLVDSTAVRDDVMKPLLTVPFENQNQIIEDIRDRIFIKQIYFETSLTKSIQTVLTGTALILIQNYSQGIIVHVEGFEVRAIQEPASEVVVRGPREGFVESTATNMTLIRRRIHHPSLRFESIKIGKITKTDIIVAYVEGIADPEVIERVRQRLRQIEVDSIQYSGDIEEFIEETTYSIFPTIGNTERPDRAASFLMEGRIIILVNGDPVILYVPHLFIDSFQTNEDYSSRPYYISIIRLFRFISFVISFTLPSLFIAAINFHKEMIPSQLIVIMTEARQRVPFPLVMEVTLMVAVFEIVREAGVRMPKPIGQAVSIVGALILGQVSVSAGLVGAPTIIIVALSVITTFLITPISEVIGVLRLVLIIPTSLFGLYGTIIFCLAVITHLVSLTSIGVPYLAPFAPLHIKDWKDTLVRFPLRFLKKRPQSIPHLRNKRVWKLPDYKEGNDP